MEKRLKESRYITGFDGIRSIAVIGVILYHLLPNQIKGGYLGVPIFFVLSGYLITDLLQQEWAINQKINIKQFYLRRMKRLYPALIGLLLFSTTYITLFQRNLLTNIRAVIVTSLLYVNNWWQIFNGMSYFDRFANESPFTHIWSLAVEGQHYLFWPLLFVLLRKYLKNWWKIFGVLLLASVISAGLMALLYVPGSDPSRVYYGTDTRIFSIWLGCALGFVWPSTRLKQDIPEKAKQIFNVAGGLSLLLIGIAFIFWDDYLSFLYRGGFFLFSLFSMVLVAVTAHPGASWNKWLTNPLFTWMGKRSYGIYLYQFPIMIFYENKIKNVGEKPITNAIIELILIFGIAELSYRFIEEPFRKFDYRKFLETLKKPAEWKKTVALPVIFVLVVSMVGIIIAPSKSASEEQTALQQRIEKNKKIADDSKKPTTATSSTEEATATSSSQTETEASSTEETQPKEKSENYGLSAAALERGQNLSITGFGDSVLLDAADELQSVFPNIVVDGEVGRQLYDSLPFITDLSEKGLLGDNVLVSLGTNGAFTENQFDEVMAAFGNRQIYWLNVRVPTRRWQNDVNSTLGKMAEKYDNLTLIDWYDYSNDNDDWFYEDQVHPNEEGIYYYISLVATTILGE